MTKVLLVEPDDDLCLFLQLAISGAGCRTIITGSFTEADHALHGTEEIDVVVTQAKLPGGSGLTLARDALQLGKRIFILRGSRRWVELRDRDGILFRGDRLAVGDFLKKAIRHPTTRRAFNAGTAGRGC